MNKETKERIERIKKLDNPEILNKEFLLNELDFRTWIATKIGEIKTDVKWLKKRQNWIYYILFLLFLYLIYIQTGFKFLFS
jgi:hypothetical protein